MEDTDQQAVGGKERERKLGKGRAKYTFKLPGTKEDPMVLPLSGKELSPQLFSSI